MDVTSVSQQKNVVFQPCVKIFQTPISYIILYAVTIFNMHLRIYLENISLYISNLNRKFLYCRGAGFITNAARSKGR